MKKVLSLMLCGVLAFSLAACGNSAAPAEDTARAAELRAEYSYYDNSVKKIINAMDVTPEQADEIFTIIVQIGADSELNMISRKYGTDNTYTVSWSGASSRELDLFDGEISEIRYLSAVIYPLENSTEYLNTQEVESVVSLIEGLSSESSRSDYEAAQAAYDSLSSSLKNNIPESLVSALSICNVSTMTLEETVEYAIEKANADKSDVTIVGGEVFIILNGEDNLTNNMIRTGMLIEACDILEVLQKRTELEDVTISWLFPLVDVYGNTSDDSVMMVYFDVETINKINFERFVYGDIPTVANEYFEHTALSN